MIQSSWELEAASARDPLVALFYLHPPVFASVDGFPADSLIRKKGTLLARIDDLVQRLLPLFIAQFLDKFRIVIRKVFALTPVFGYMEAAPQNISFQPPQYFAWQA
jgi:hypothetical protein